MPKARLHTLAQPRHSPRETVAPDSSTQCSNRQAVERLDVGQWRWRWMPA
jgi:hypothetical protein